MTASPKVSVAPRLRHAFFAATLLWVAAVLLGGGAETYLSRGRFLQRAASNANASATYLWRPPRGAVKDPAPLIGKRALFVRIISHNMFVYLMLLLGVLSWGIPTVLTTASNAWALGWMIASAVATGVSPSIVAMVILPHGILEITGFTVGAAVGLQGWYYGTFAMRGQLQLTSRSVQTLLFYSGVGALILLIAAMVESSVTLELVLLYSNNRPL